MSQFGGSPRDDDFGYFTPQQPSTSTSQFGGAPSAPSPFGTAAPATFGYATPQPYASRPAKKSGVGAKAVLGFLGIGLLVVVGGWFGWAVYQTHKPIVIPATLGGRPVLADPRMTALADQALEQVRADNPDLSIEAGIYGSQDDLTVLVVGRGRLDVDGEWADAGVALPSTVGKNECALMPGDQIAVCIRTSRTLGVETFVIGGTLAQASAALDEAWTAQ